MGNGYLKGKMWRVVGSLYVNSSGLIFSEGKSSEIFPLKQGVAQGCILSPTLFLICINGRLCEIEKYSELGVEFSENTLSGHLFADDFVELAETESALQKLIDIVHIYC